MPLLNPTPPVTAFDTTQGSGIFVLEDTDEDEWVYVAQSKQSESIFQKLQRKLVTAPLTLLTTRSSTTEGEMQHFERRFMRISIKDGHATMALFDSDEVTETAVAYYDLHEIRNVRNLIIDENDALPFVTIGSDGTPVVENIFGHIGLRLELDSLSTAAFDRRGQALVDASQQEQDLHSLLIQRKLEIKGKATSLHIAFSSIQQRDAWAAWLSELIVLKELQNVQGRGELAADLQREDDALNSPRLATERSDMQPAVRGFIKKFLGGVKSAASDKEPPNGGKIEARGPADRMFTQYVAIPRFAAGEVRLIPKKKQSTIGSLFAIDQRHATAEGGRILRLTDRTKIQASVPLASDFQILEENGIWTFDCKTAEARNDYVRWFRLVKGRGDAVAQTDAETFTFLERTDAMRAEVEKTLHTIVSSSEAASRSLRAQEQEAASSGSPRKKNKSFMNFDDEDDDEDDNDQEQVLSDGGEGDGPLVIGLDFDERRTGREKAPAAMRRRPAGTAQQTAEEEFDEHHSGRLTPPSPTMSAHSIRPFKYFALHSNECPMQYVDEMCQPHVAGRSYLFAGPEEPIHGSKAKQHQEKASRSSRPSQEKVNASKSRLSSSNSRSGVNAAAVEQPQTSSTAQLNGSRLLPTSFFLLGEVDRPKSASEKDGGRGGGPSSFSLSQHAGVFSPSLPPRGSFSSSVSTSGTNSIGARR